MTDENDSAIFSPTCDPDRSRCSWDYQTIFSKASNKWGVYAVWVVDTDDEQCAACIRRVRRDGRIWVSDRDIGR